MEEENRRLKSIVADLTLEKTALEDVVKNVLRRHTARSVAPVDGSLWLVGAAVLRVDGPASLHLPL